MSYLVAIVADGISRGTLVARMGQEDDGPTVDQEEACGIQYSH